MITASPKGMPLALLPDHGDLMEDQIGQSNIHTFTIVLFNFLGC
jgi:hypothetical protein